MQHLTFQAKEKQTTESIHNLAISTVLLSFSIGIVSAVELHQQLAVLTIK